MFSFLYEEMMQMQERKVCRMKVLMINGGPHQEGCTYTALKEVAGTWEKEAALPAKAAWKKGSVFLMILSMRFGVRHTRQMDLFSGHRFIMEQLLEI